jgi:hypothetical protein
MPDPVPMLQAMGIAAATAAALVLLLGWPWRAPRPALVRAGAVLGTALGFFLGCWWTGQLPQWPPVQVRDRMLLLLVPAVVVAELAALLPASLSWLAWLLRLAIVLGATRLLLHDSVYLTSDAGPESWTPAETWLNLAGWSAALGVTWVLLAMLARRTQSRSIPLALALACLGGGIILMLSGYATGGPMAFALAAALTGVMASSLVLSGPRDPVGAVAVGVVGLFALLVSGRFFAELVLLNAALIFFGLLLCWLFELPPRFSGIGKILLVAVPIGLAVLLAQQKFAESSKATATSPGDLYGRSPYDIDYGK